MIATQIPSLTDGTYNFLLKFEKSFYCLLKFLTKSYSLQLVLQSYGCRIYLRVASFTKSKLIYSGEKQGSYEKCLD